MLKDQSTSKLIYRSLIKNIFCFGLCFLTIISYTHATELVSLNNSGLQSISGSLNSTISEDGRFVVFESAANDLVADDNNNHVDIFVRDLRKNTTYLVSYNTTNTSSGNSDSSNPTISTNGRFVAFESTATDLIADDLNNSADIFVRDLQTNTTFLVSKDVTGTTSADGGSFESSITADGRFIAFSSSAMNLTTDISNNGELDISERNIFVHDTQTNTTILVNRNILGMVSENGASFAPSISADGRFVAFESTTADLVADDNNNRTDVFVRDLQTNTTIEVSRNVSDSALANGDSSNPTISADGRLVTFESTATDLVADDNNNRTDVFVRDLQTNTTIEVSRNVSDSALANGDSSNPTISADGRLVTFESTATDLVADDNNNRTDVFVRDLQTNTTIEVSRNVSDSALANGDSSNPAISADGRFVAFESKATDLITNDTNQITTDIFFTSLTDSGPILAAVLPYSRSVQVDNLATAFASIINTSNETEAVFCSIAPNTVIPASFIYQTTDAMNMLTGTHNTRADIVANGTQSFVFGFIPTSPFAPTDVALDFNCINTDVAPYAHGVNSFLLSADSNPVPDIIGLTTVTDLVAPTGSTSFFAVGSSNVGIAGEITVSTDDNNQGLPLTLNICQTDTSTGICTSAVGPIVNLNYAGSSNASFAIFVQPTGVIANDPVKNRIFIRFTDSAGIIRGATSTAIRTQ